MFKSLGLVLGLDGVGGVNHVEVTQVSNEPSW